MDQPTLETERLVLQELGMRHEGTARQHFRKWDTFLDVERYGLLRDDRSMSHFHLFAYGTLRDRAGSPGRELLRDCERVGEGTVRGALYDAGEYPALVLDGTRPVPGVIWRCPADLLARLDRYEGTGERLFQRVALRVGDVPCWLYVAGPKLGAYLTPDRLIEPHAEAPGPPYL